MLANWVGTAGYVWGAAQRGRPAAAGGLSSPRPHPRRGARSREEGPARPGRAAGEVHAGTELLSAPRHILRSLLPCNFSSALRSNSKPEPATADGGGCPGFPPWALCGSPTHPAGGGAPCSRGFSPHGAAPERRACPPCQAICAASSRPHSHLPKAGCGRRHLRGGGRSEWIAAIPPTPGQQFLSCGPRTL